MLSCFPTPCRSRQSVPLSSQPPRRLHHPHPVVHLHARRKHNKLGSFPRRDTAADVSSVLIHLSIRNHGKSIAKMLTFWQCWTYKGQPVAAASGRDASTTRPQSDASRSRTFRGNVPTSPSRTARGNVPTSPSRTARGNVPTTCTVTISFAKKNDPFIPHRGSQSTIPTNTQSSMEQKRELGNG